MSNKFLSLVKKGIKGSTADKQKAYQFFVDQVEVADARALAKKSDKAVASVIKHMIDRYEGKIKPLPHGKHAVWPTEKAEKAKKAKAKKSKPKKQKAQRKKIPEGGYAPYHHNGGLNILGHFADMVEGYEFDALSMVNANFRIERDKDSDKARIKYLSDLWYDTIDLAIEQDLGNWLTRIVRHQIAANGKSPKFAGAPLTVNGITIEKPSAYGALDSGE